MGLVAGAHHFPCARPCVSPSPPILLRTRTHPFAFMQHDNAQKIQRRKLPTGRAPPRN